MHRAHVLPLSAHRLRVEQSRNGSHTLLCGWIVVGSSEAGDQANAGAGAVHVEVQYLGQEILQG
jgi:hypothetical protein